MDEFTKWVKDLAEKFTKSEDFLHEVSKSVTSKDKVGDFLYEIGLKLYSISKFKLSLTVMEKALEEYHKVDNNLGLANCYRTMGGVLLCLGEFKPAMEIQEKGLEIAKKIGDRTSEAGCLANIGALHYCQGKSSKALNYYHEALSISVEIGNKVIETKCCQGLGASYFGLGEFNKAIEFFDRGVKTAIAIGDKAGIAGCHTNLGAVYDQLGDFTKAMMHYEKALEIFKDIGNRQGEAACYTNLGNACKNIGQLKKAISYHQDSLRIAIEIKDPSAESRSLNNLGISYYALGDLMTAVDYYRKALKIKIKIGDKDGERICYSNLGESYDQLDEFEKALDYYSRALEILDETGNTYGKKICLDEVGKICFNRGDYKRAALYYRQVAQLLEGMRKEHIPNKYRNSFWKDNITMFDNLVISEFEIGKKAEAFEDSERAKGRIIMDFIISREIDTIESNTSPLGLRDIKELAKRIERNIVLFRVTKKGTFVFIVDLTGKYDVIKFSNFCQNRLDELIVRTIEERPIDGWVYKYSRFKFVQGEARRLLSEGKHNDAYNLLLEKEKQWFESMDIILRLLYQELLGEVFKRFQKGDRVVIVPNKSLNILPLHACFYEENGKYHYLLEDHEISYAPNCNILDLCYKREAEGRNRNSLFAITNPVPPYELVFSEWEVEEIGKLFKEKEVYFKKEAKNALIDKANNFGTIHLSTHGVYDLGSSIHSRLHLGKGVDLTLEEIFEKVRLSKSWLVCLSACESGLTDYRDVADEFIGLQAGFLYAGAPTVIASLWAVSDFTTAFIMIKTYENILKHGLSKTQALRKAQLWLKELTAGEALKLIKSKELELEYSTRMAREDISPLRRAISLEDPESKPFAHPYYWAGFQIFGA